MIYGIFHTSGFLPNPILTSIYCIAKIIKISINMQKYFKIRGILCIVNIHNM